SRIWRTSSVIATPLGWRDEANAVRPSRLLLPGDACFREGRHAVMASNRRLHDADRERAARAFAEPHSKIEQRNFADELELVPMGALSREVGGETMVESAVVEGQQHGSGRAHNEAVEQHRRSAQARSEDRACDCCGFAPPEARQNLERIIKIGLMTG